jgi:hypothetical protein
MERPLWHLAHGLLADGRQVRLISMTCDFPPRYALVAGLLATFAGYFVHGLFEVSYYDYKVLLLFWLLVGITDAVWRLHIDRVEAPFTARAAIHAENALRGTGAP